MRSIKLSRSLVPFVFVLAACTVDTKENPPADSASAAALPAAPAPATLGMGDTTAAERTPSTAMKLEVNLQTRKVSATGDSGTPTYPVAVGSTKWPTQTGEWVIKQVVINPEWTPPDESWAEQKDPREPGDPKNPLGKAQLVYDPPRSIHGTNEPASIGKAVSHGSIRMRNQDIIALSIRVLKAGGATEDSAWVSQALANPKEKKIVDLPNPVPIRVY